MVCNIFSFFCLSQYIYYHFLYLWPHTSCYPINNEKILILKREERFTTSWSGSVMQTSTSMFDCLIPLIQTSQDICCVVFALFNVVWATLFLERWKRREAELAYRWGTLDTPAESLEEPRPQFRVRFGARAWGWTSTIISLIISPMPHRWRSEFF